MSDITENEQEFEFYYIIDKWIVSEIIKKEFDTFKENWEYYTTWYDKNWNLITILDLDKSTPKYLLKFLLENWEEVKKSWLLMYIIIFFIILFTSLWLYYWYSSLTDKSIEKTTKNIISDEKLNSFIKKDAKSIEVKKVITPKEVEKEVEFENENKIDDNIKQLEDNNRKLESINFWLNNQINTLNSEISILNNEKTYCLSRKKYYKEKYTNLNLLYENNSNELFEKNNALNTCKSKVNDFENSILWDTTELQSYFWKKVLDKCKKSDTNKKCIEIFNLFYNKK